MPSPDNCLHESIGVDQGSGSGTVLCFDCGQEFVKATSLQDDSSQLVKHALAEAQRVGMDLTDFPNKELLDLVRVFASQGHSESSAHWTRECFNVLARYDGLPMLNADTETPDAPPPSPPSAPE
jgi:hypothetical protein